MANGNQIIKTDAQTINAWNRDEARKAERAAYLEGVKAGLEAAAQIADDESACQTEYYCDTGERAAAAIRAIDPETVGRKA